MLQINRSEDGSISLTGILDSSESSDARRFFDTVNASCDVDFRNLTYISSAGLGVLLATQKRLAGHGKKLRLVNVPQHLGRILDLARFDLVFEIQRLETGD